MRLAAFGAAVLLASSTVAGAVGSDSSDPPTPTETTTVCPDGEIWDDDKKACVSAESSSLSDDDRYRGLRELAYQGRYRSALIVAEAMDPASDRTLTYKGFIARKTGDWDRALALYQAALLANPDNILARSYLGQGHAARGEYPEAELQLAEIRARRGSGTWAEEALVLALSGSEETGY